ncbi:MAG: methyltransferase domain-containing protein [Chloroflexi bacterium]|nr:methyltransferase domain-containing protein [Chloroflexota bacterium]
MSVQSDYNGFDPRSYLQEYYADVGPENLALLRFLVRAFRQIPPDSLTLDFGGGPTLYASLVAAGRVREIHLADYSPANLKQVRLWLGQASEAFDWTPFVRAILELEGLAPTLQAVANREAQTRRAITCVMPCDAKAAHPLGEGSPLYDVVMTNFCLEAAAQNKEEWQRCLANVVSLLRPGGYLLLSAIKGACAYHVGSATFGAVPLDEDDLRETLMACGLAADTIAIESVPADRSERIYTGLMFVSARRHGGEVG